MACPEEVAFLKGWLDEEQLAELARPLLKTSYGQYLDALAREGRP